MDDISVRIGYDEHSSTQISQPIQYEGNVYYVEITYPDGTVICPSGQSEHQAELQFRISVPDASKCWDATNDYSFEGLGKSGNECVKTERITMYDSGVLIYGVEPDGTTPADNPVVTTTTSGDEVLQRHCECTGLCSAQAVYGKEGRADCQGRCECGYEPGQSADCQRLCSACTEAAFLIILCLDYPMYIHRVIFFMQICRICVIHFNVGRFAQFFTDAFI